MVGQKWQPAEGTIVGTLVDYTRAPGRDGVPRSAAYDIDMRAPDGSRQRVQVPSGSHHHLQPGQVVRLEVHARTGEIRLHPHESQLVIGFDTNAAGMQDYYSAANGGMAAASGTSGFPVGGTGEGVRQLLSEAFTDQLRMMARPEALDVMRRMRTGDPDARAAAMDQFRQLLRQQAQVIQQGEIHALGQAHSPADRIATLQEMANRGQITPEEYEAKRQQILNEI